MLKKYFNFKTSGESLKSFNHFVNCEFKKKTDPAHWVV